MEERVVVVSLGFSFSVEDLGSERDIWVDV